MLPVALLLLSVGQSWAQRPPPNYSPDALPDTSFSCRGRQAGGYYADVEAGCQMFHVCGSSQGPSFRFLCPNDTVFDQQNLICANWFQVVCEHDSVLHARNFEIFKTHSDKETSLNTLYEDDLPELEDYEYETGFGTSQAFDSAPRFSAQRATTASSAKGQFDQFIAASTARPVIVTAPNAGRWRGSTVTGSRTTESSRFPARQNSLDRGAGKRLTSSRDVEAGERLGSVSESVERSSQAFGSLNSQSLQEQKRSGGKSEQTSGDIAQDSTSIGSQSFRRTSGRVPPTSAPAGSQTIERTSHRFNSIAPSTNSRQRGKRPESSRPFQKASGRTTLTAAINVVHDFSSSGPAVNAAPTAAAVTTDAVTLPQSQLPNNIRPSSSGGKSTLPTPSRASASTALKQSQSASRGLSESDARGPVPDRKGLNDINTNGRPATGPAKDSHQTDVRPAPTSTPSSPARVTFSAPVEPVSNPLELEPQVTTTAPAPPLSPVARRFFGSGVLPQAAALTVQSSSDKSVAVRQNTAFDAGVQSEIQSEDDVEVTTFRPRVSTTPHPPPTSTTGEEFNVEGNIETSTDSGTEIITEATTQDRPQQSSGTTVPTVRRRGSRRRSGSIRRGSSNAGSSQAQAKVATSGRNRSRPTARPASSRTATATATPPRPRSFAGRRGRGGRRFNSSRAAVKPAQRRRQKLSRANANVQGVQQNDVGVDLSEAKLGGNKNDDAFARSTTETSSVEDDQATASSISRSSGARPQAVQAVAKKLEESPVTTEDYQRPVTTTAATRTTEAAATPLVIRRKIRVRGRPSRRPRRLQTTTTASPVAVTPAPSPEPSPVPVLLPTNKEAARGSSRLLRRPKLQLSSALPGVGRSRRLQQDTAAREARSGATRLVAPSRGRYGRRPAARRPSVQASQRRGAGPLLSDYDYEYYDDEGDVLFRKLAEANELLLDGLTRVRRQN